MNGARSALLLSSHFPAHRLYRFARRAMACTWELYLAGPDEKYAEQAARAAFAELDRLEAELSRFVADSDISRLNAARAGQPVRLGLAAYECLEAALRVWRQTQGAFDVTVGGGKARSAQDVSAAVGHAMRLTLDQMTRSATRYADQVVVDLGGIGKGYALDQLVRILLDWKVEAGLVHCGQSTVCAWGTLPKWGGWRLVLRDPDNVTAEVARIWLRDAALSGSANVLHGAHIVDPRTGQAASAALAAWAIAPTATLADAFSTAFLVLGSDGAAVCCRQNPGLGAILLLQSGSQRRIEYHGTAQAHVQSQAQPEPSAPTAPLQERAAQR